ncbi:ALK and LTK ligand 2a-like [Xyrauchen texanus]|uniref:ALK and LTK ligand 2a-like n=1 Tax=Xyrauchen texanus TaxID=154827 RepID=UPI0022424FAD|nr:ALK and LTK ligand 2a-like [Xyrauchen texanus]XP_051962340.1 ALK and LTK ligand 2a-like [Xyrauchen texanus]XP_051962341.1 ALK and LTK ligand 2a-like [Xyrauchen texanus]
MRALRAPVVVMGLVLLICTTVHSDASANNDDNKDENTWFRRIIDIMRQMENSAGVERAQSTSKTELALQTKDSKHNLKTKNGEPILEIFPRDLRKKEKIIKHLTGPLYFSPKCRKHVYRLYHNTRDCTIPAYYKRCARLLTRLAESPRCQES